MCLNTPSWWQIVLSALLRQSAARTLLLELIVALAGASIRRLLGRNLKHYRKAPNRQPKSFGPSAGLAHRVSSQGGLVVRKAILGLTCFIALQLAVTVAHAQSTVKIGLIMTYTGQFTDAAAQMDNGIKLYMKQNGDTVGGKKIELIRKDTAGAPDVAKRLAQELIVNDNVDILAGFVITPEALAVAELSAQAKKFMVVMNAATSIITTKSPYIVRSSLTLPQNCEVLGTWAFQNGAKKVFTLV